ncbi:DUF3298 and DUF4163 domain-containing protein [Sporosarcina sp. Sa2YVA2]|uniref:DUF3298 and DUF4163 domain-containing protein n=1 Tax=Sporosarcina quadrami TaxID=2762234 RepID=A0ABR8U8M3_9BACL|nr:DUF3298 and DUF4163 domain-containing protein [Sporosarcina quadrami]MBD7984382.1 DUF3298 and DUF4163 domain-containing protein [Sporosarcina quadrami]
MLRVNDFPVTIQTKKLPHAATNVNVYYPSVVGLTNYTVQQKINHTIISTLNKMLIDQYFYESYLVEMLANFEIKTNERGILSLNLIVYSFTGGAHGMTVVKSLTFDVKTGRHFSLKELFKPGSDYEKEINMIIRQRIKDWDIQLLEPPFKSIRPDQDYYIADVTLVVYFQLYEIAPYASGFPYFPIPILDLATNIKTEGPLNTMMTFT